MQKPHSTANASEWAGEQFQEPGALDFRIPTPFYRKQLIKEAKRFVCRFRRHLDFRSKSITFLRLPISQEEGSPFPEERLP